MISPLETGTAEYPPLLPVVDEMGSTDREYLHKYKLMNAMWILPSLNPSDIKLFNAFVEYESPRNTTNSNSNVEVEQEVRGIFDAQYDEIFEDGMDSELYNRVKLIISYYFTQAVNEITRLITREFIKPGYAVETLRAISSIDKNIVYDERLWLLERSLRHSSAKVRDAAAVGLAAMEDPTAIPYLEDAIRKERNPDLRIDLEQVRDLLEQLPR